LAGRFGRSRWTESAAPLFFVDRPIFVDRPSARLAFCGAAFSLFLIQNADGRDESGHHVSSLKKRVRLRDRLPLALARLTPEE
jgi:hypothetical protein